ncbi:MAG: WD40 repeat domain-containing protein, partial [Planctomycetota bacterium]
SIFVVVPCESYPQETVDHAIVVAYPSDIIYTNTAVACSPDGNRIASSSWPGARINIWDLGKMAVVRDLRHHQMAVSSMCFSADGKKLASASGDGQVCLWNDETGTVTVLRDPVTCNGRAAGLRISPSGRYLVYNFTWNPHGHWLTETVVYNMREETEELCLKGHYYPAFLPDDVLLTAVVPREGVPPWGHSECLIQIRKLSKNEEPERLFSGQLEVSAIATAPDGRAVALGSFGEISILTLPDKRLISTGGHRFGDVHSLAFSPDSKRLLAVSEHSVMWSIDTEAGHAESRVTRVPKGGPIAFTPDGGLLIIGREAVELRDPSGQRVLVLLQVIPWTDKPEWIAFTPKGYFKKSDGAGAFLKWRVKDGYAPFEVNAKSYDQPERVLQALPSQPLSRYERYEQLRKKNLLFPEEEALLTREAAKRANEQLARGVFFPLEIKPNDQLQMVVSLKGVEMVSGQPLELQATLSNVSSSNLYINAAPQPFYQAFSPFQCRIFDANGKFYWGHNAFVQGFSVSDLKVIEVQPYGSVNLALSVQFIKDFDTPVSHSWPHVFPGKFLLTLTYDSRRAYNLVRGQEAVEVPNAWTGQLASNSVQFRVRDK